VVGTRLTAPLWVDFPVVLALFAPVGIEIAHVGDVVPLCCVGVGVSVGVACVGGSSAPDTRAHDGGAEVLKGAAALAEAEAGTRTRTRARARAKAGRARRVDVRVVDRAAIAGARADGVFEVAPAAGFAACGVEVETAWLGAAAVGRRVGGWDA
jgi:hypothetical protein